MHCQYRASSPVQARELDVVGLDASQSGKMEDLEDYAVTAIGNYLRFCASVSLDPSGFQYITTKCLHD